jgi:hypothetical protein
MKHIKFVLSKMAAELTQVTHAITVIVIPVLIEFSPETFYKLCLNYG